MLKIGMTTTTQHPCSVNTGWGAESYINDLVISLNKLGGEVILFASEGSDVPENGELIICNSEDKILEHKEKFKECDIIHDWSSRKLIHDYCQTHGIKSIATNFNVHFLFPTIHKNICTVSDRHKYLGLQGRSGFEGTPWAEQVGYTGHLRNAKTVYLGLNPNDYSFKNEKEDYFLYFNSFDYRKGVHVAISLAIQMGFKLIVAGETKGHPEHMQTFKDLKPIMDEHPNISYMTDVDNLTRNDLMRNSKALLFPSMFEQPFAFVVVQALACGTPVIVFNHGAFPEQIIHRETGFLCNNDQDFMDAIKNIDDIKPINCRSDVLRRFDIMRTANEYLDLYNRIVKYGEEW